MRTQLPQPNSPYPYVVMWCRFMGSYSYYTEMQVARARETNAPADAVYERTERGGKDTGEWVVLQDVRNDLFREACELWRTGKLKESDGWPNTIT